MVSNSAAPNHIRQINSFMNMNSSTVVGRVATGSAPTTPNRNGVSKIIGSGNVVSPLSISAVSNNNLAAQDSPLLSKKPLDFHNHSFNQNYLGQQDANQPLSLIQSATAPVQSTV